MSKREHYISQGDVPFLENLVFYAPLEYGDTTDNVSGTDVTVISPGVLSYDMNKSMYLFSATTSGSIFDNLFYWNTPELGLIGNSSTINDMHYTIHFNVVFTMLGYYSRCVPNISYIKRSNMYGYVGNGNTGSWGYDFQLNRPYNIVAVIDGNSQDIYVDKSFVSTVTPFFNININKNDLDFGVKIFYIHQGSGNAQNGAGYYKDIRIYNRALTAAEVAEL